MAAITMYELIPAPQRFVVDLGKVTEDRAVQVGLLQRVEEAALPVFLEYLKLFLGSAVESVWTNISYMPMTFRFVFRDVSFGENLILGLGIWAVLHLIGLVAATAFNFWNKVNAMPQQLVNYANALINTKHIRVKEEEIDVTGVPNNITVESLRTLFDSINFNDPTQPGYMPPAARIEGKTTYTPEQLREGLNTFIRNVTTRQAFIGTPPAWNLAQLHQFYEQIEKAVRYTVHKVVSDLDKFKERCHEWRNLPAIEREYDECVYQNKPVGERLLKGHQNYVEYNNLLAAVGGPPVDFGIAGGHCGARYTGDATDLYLLHQGKVAEQTLEASLIALLAKKRVEIARANIAEHLGQDTHQFAAYMARLGGVLGLPGMTKVVEHLGWLTRSPAFLLERFFEKYTPECIRKAVQEQFGSSLSFREQVYDWLKENGGEWEKSAFQEKKNAIMQSIQKIPDVERGSPIEKQVECLEEWIKVVIQKKIIVEEGGVLKIGKEVLPDYKTQWSGFLDVALSFQGCKGELDRLLGEGTLLEKMQRRQHWKNTFEHSVFAKSRQEIVAAVLKGSRFDSSHLIATYHWIERVNNILTLEKVLPPHVETLIRCNKEGSYGEVIDNQLELARRSAFLEALHPDKVQQITDEIQKIDSKQGQEGWIVGVKEVLNRYGADPLSDEYLEKCFAEGADIGAALKVKHRIPSQILEWLLVAQGVLLPPKTEAQRV